MPGADEYRVVTAREKKRITRAATPLDKVGRHLFHDVVVEAIELLEDDEDPCRDGHGPEELLVGPVK